MAMAETGMVICRKKGGRVNGGKKEGGLWGGLWMEKRRESYGCEKGGGLWVAQGGGL